MKGLLSEAVPRGYVAAFRLLGSRDEAKDACHEAVVKALAGRASYDPARPFYPWFHRILKNHCLDRLAGRKTVAGRTAPFPEEPAGPTPTAEALVLRDERSRKLAQAIEALPDDLRQILELRHFEDATYEEMAEILEIPVGTVMSRLYRARKRVRDQLAADPGFFGQKRRTS